MTTAGTSPPGSGAPAQSSPPKLLDAWEAGIVSPVTWVPVPLGGSGYTIQLAARPLAVGGVYLTVTWADILALVARTAGEQATLLPVTKATMDARWSATPAANRIILEPKTWLYKPGAPPPDEQERRWSAEINQAAPADPSSMIDGPWKEWILRPASDTSNPDNAINYGLRKDKQGAVWQTPGTMHNNQHRDYSQLFAPMLANATGPDGKLVFIPNILADTHPLTLALGGPFVVPPQIAGLTG